MPLPEVKCPPPKSDPCFAMHYLGHIEEAGPIPAGALHLAWDPNNAGAAELDAAWLVIDADTEAANGAWAFAMRTKVNCGTALVTFDAWMTYREKLYPVFSVNDHRLISTRVLEQSVPVEFSGEALPFVSRALCSLSEPEWAQRAASRLQ